MAKYLTVAGVVWVFLALIIGMILVVTVPPKSSGEASVSANDENKREPRLVNSTREIKESRTSARTELHVAGTPAEHLPNGAAKAGVIIQ